MRLGDFSAAEVTKLQMRGVIVAAKHELHKFLRVNRRMTVKRDSRHGLYRGRGLVMFLESDNHGVE